MPFLDLPMDVPEIGLAERGEYELEVLSTQVQEGEYPRLSIRMQIVGEPTIADIYHNLWLPNSQDDEKRRIQKTSAIKQFVEGFGLVWEGSFNTEDLIGCRGRCLVDIQPANTERGYDARNRIAEVLKRR